MSAAHTPGPWKLNPGGYIHAKPTPAHLAKFPKNRRVAIGYASSFAEATPEEVEANARLIAAAPALAYALECIVQAWPAHGSDVNNPIADAMAAKARAALAEVGVKS